jgi:hypothetical protein
VLASGEYRRKRQSGQASPQAEPSVELRCFIDAVVIPALLDRFLRERTEPRSSADPGTGLPRDR